MTYRLPSAKTKFVVVSALNDTSKVTDEFPEPRVVVGLVSEVLKLTANSEAEIDGSSILMTSVRGVNAIVVPEAICDH